MESQLATQEAGAMEAIAEAFLVILFHGTSGGQYAANRIDVETEEKA